MEFTHPEYLVSTAWLADHLDDPTVRVLDVTAKLSSSLENGGGAELWGEAHIPGSQFFDVPAGRGALSDPDASLPWMWPSPSRFEEVMAGAGVGAGNRVVVVARTPRAGIDSGTMWCTRAWWTMHHYGVDCAILHGGIERWEAEGRPLVDGEEPTPEPVGGPVVAATGWESARATIDDVARIVSAQEGGDGAACLIDALPAENYAGANDGYGGRPGHITGAVNLPFRSLIEAETCGFVGAEAMGRALTEVGALGASQVVTYCGGAIAATVDAFCLKLLGHHAVSVYDASLMEWAADPGRPMTNPTADR